MRLLNYWHLVVQLFYLQYFAVFSKPFWSFVNNIETVVRTCLDVFLGTPSVSENMPVLATSWPPATHQATKHYGLTLRPCAAERSRFSKLLPWCRLWLDGLNEWGSYCTYIYICIYMSMYVCTWVYIYICIAGSLVASNIICGCKPCIRYFSSCRSFGVSMHPNWSLADIRWCIVVIFGHCS